MKYRIIPIIICLFSLNTVQAQTKSYKNEFGLRSDNDSYLAQGSDRYYTNGLFLSFRHALDQNKLNGSKIHKKILGFEIGQRMYNAQSGYLPDSRYIDRPFTAYLFAESSLTLLYTSESTLKLNTQIGVIGPAALGQEAQNVIHDTFGFYTLNGWQYQLKNEVSLNLAAEYSHLITRGKSIDLAANAYGHLGNAFTGAGVGLLLRAGNFNQFFQSASTESIVNNRLETTRTLHDYEFFFYGRPIINYVGYDATIEGGLFRSDKGPFIFDQKKLVLSQQVGVTYAKNRWTIDANAIFKTKEVESQAKAHQWASVGLKYRFN
ncbi:MAG: lipid A deacylase LpxR family protein [Sphingobacteriaceae bacterium]